MLDADTFLTRLYVAVDDYCKSEGVPPRALPGHRGPAPALAPSEVVTLAVYAQWARFASERAFYRHAAAHLRGAFPTLPARPQLNRLVRAHQRLVVAFQFDPHHEPPTWPSEPGSPTQQLHLDLGVTDLEAAVADALELGARLAAHQPQEDVRVLLDPEGHPFCLYIDDEPPAG